MQFARLAIFMLFGTTLLVSAPLRAEDSPAKRGTMFVGNLAEACVTSAMTASILTALRDKGLGQAEAERYVAGKLEGDANRDFYVGLTSQNAKIVFGFPAVDKQAQEQIALARCARFVKGKPQLTAEQVEALIPAVLACQSSGKPDAPADQCVFAAVFESAS